ncbi:50S ribosomal protein L29 [Phycisphaerales bacterium]|nr:50S ribosomal protein L29 [Phycisphaerales bacterium]
MKGKEVHSMRDDEILVEVARLHAQIFDLRSQTVTEKVEDTSQFKKIRRDVARLLTESNTRRLAKTKK